ncbi:MAG TPA: murein L,D-transpeptidase catalytic domain family protein [Sphingomonadaceae bacterium]
MDLDRRHFIGAAAAVSAAACGTALLARSGVARHAASTAKPAPKPVPAAAKQAEQPTLLRNAVAALDHHGIRQRDLVGLVDFSAHSSKRRFQLVDLAGGSILGAYLVAHGKGSDPHNTGWLHRFSNEPGSNASSQGSFMTGEKYFGEHGASRRLIGLDPDNNQALSRAIVLHGASYVDHQLIEAQGHIGRSLGCFAVGEHLIGEVMERLGAGRLLFAAK